MLQYTGLYQAQAPELRGRKHREANHAHVIVALRFYDRDAIRNWLSVGRRSLLSAALVKRWKQKKSQPSSRSWRLWRGFDGSFA